MIRARTAGAAVVTAVVMTVTGCSGSGAAGHSAAAPRPVPTTSIPAFRVSTGRTGSSAPGSVGSSAAVSSPAASATAGSPIVRSSAGSSSAAPSSAGSSSSPRGHRPTIVIDPGHSVSVHGVDPKTGIDVSDYENEPEMHDVFDVATIVKDKLRAAGYRVVMTKKSVDQPENLGQRAQVANRVHADLALSIHDQAGSNGGIPFGHGNSIVYYQSVGDYREATNGTKVYFTNRHVAALSKKYGEIFQREREKVQGDTVQLLGNTGYNVGSRGLPAGNIWIVQLLSKVPWIYNEAGGNTGSSSGLDEADKLTYARGLVKSVEHCIPPPR